MKTKNLILISMFAALTAVGAFIKIPTPFCPITLQIMFTTLAGIILGGKNGALSVGIYVLLGLIGVPIFTGGGGISYVLYPTFGFLIGFIIGTYVTGKICHSGKFSKKRIVAGSLVGMIPIFLIGTIYDCLITMLLTDPTASIATVAYYCLLPLPGDIVLCTATAFLGERIITALERNGYYERENAC